MSDKKVTASKIILGSTKGKPVRFSYLNVHEPRLNTESGKMEHSVLVLIPKTNEEDIAAVKAAIELQKKGAWLDEKTGKLKLPPKFWNPLLDGDNDVKQNGESFGSECKGHYLMNAKTGEDSAPQVVGTTRDSTGKFATLGKSEIKSGDWGRVSVNLTAYVKGTGGVGCYLNSVQKTVTGEPLSSRSSAEDDFKDFDDAEEDDALLG